MLYNKSQLDDRILRLLALRPGSTAELIHSYLRREGKIVSLRGIFKALRSLQDNDVVIKVGNSYSLRISWVLELRAFTDKILEHYEKRSVFYTQLPEAGDSAV